MPAARHSTRRAFFGRAAHALVSFVLIGVISCGDDSTNPPTNPGPAANAPVVVVLGDSLTSGPGLRTEDAYPAVLQERARTAGLPHRFVNAGVSGDTTADALRRVDAALIPETRVLVVALGVNDGIVGVPIDTVKQNLRQIIQRARTRNISVLLAGMESPPTHGLDYSFRFHNIFPDLAAEFNVRLMPFLLQNVLGRADLNLPDGLHPNTAGMRVIADQMWPFLEPLLRATSGA